jgi:uncharacterized protein YndB with AHSA1/START domain
MVQQGAGYDRSMARRSDELTLEMKRVLPAPAAVVFASFADANELATWWGPKGFSTPSLEFDPRVGESYRIEMQPPEGDHFHLTGEFREVDVPARLAYTFVWEEPDPDDVETEVGLSFRDLGESTEVAFTQGPFKTEGRRALHRDGWTDAFDKLERLVSAPPAARTEYHRAVEQELPTPTGPEPLCSLPIVGKTTVEDAVFYAAVGAVAMFGWVPLPTAGLIGSVHALHQRARNVTRTGAVGEVRGGLIEAVDEVL